MTPIVLLTGVDAEAMAAAMIGLQFDLPRAVAVRHHIDPERETLERWVSDVSGAIEHVTTPLSHACVPCALREDIVPTLERLGRDGRWATIIAHLPIAAEARQVCNVLAWNAALSSVVRVGCVVTAMDGERVVDDLLGDALLRERGCHSSFDDIRGVGAAALALAGRRSDLVWNVGFGAAVLLAPLHQLAEDGRGLRELTDWLTWVDGATRPSGMLLLGAYAVVAAASSITRRAIAIAITVPALMLLGGAAYSWPRADHATTPIAAQPAGPTTGTAELGGFGSVTLITDREAGRAVSIELKLLDSKDQPLTPYAPPTLTITNADLSLGDATLTSTGPGTYRAEVTIPTNGDWTAQVSVRTSEFDNPIAQVPFTVS